MIRIAQTSITAVVSALISSSVPLHCEGSRVLIRTNQAKSQAYCFVALLLTDYADVQRRMDQMLRQSSSFKERYNPQPTLITTGKKEDRPIVVHI